MMIVAEGLEKTYTSGGRPLKVLDAVDLSVEDESFLAVVGPSGSGKTTLLGLLAGLDEPSGGSVVLNGQDIFTLTEDGRSEFRAQNIGFVFQTFHLLPTLTAIENVLVPLELRGLTAGARADAETLLERVGLGGRLDHYPAQLSGGEQQRVALARALVHGPQVILADEPTGELDTATATYVLDMLRSVARSGTVVVLATHDPLALEFVDEAFFVRDGTLHRPDRGELQLWLTEGEGDLATE